MFEIKVECPECKKIWIARQGTDAVNCDCHLYCTQGDKPQDCSVTLQEFSGQLGWPTGLHVDAEDEGDDVMHRTYYCSTHDEYYYKVPVLIDCDWDKWFSRRAPEKLRMSHGEY